MKYAKKCTTKGAAFAAAVTLALGLMAGTAALRAESAARMVTIVREPGAAIVAQALQRSEGQKQADQALADAKAQHDKKPASPAAGDSLHSLIVSATGDHKPYRLPEDAKSGEHILASNVAEGGFPDLAAFDFNTASIYPGAIIQGKNEDVITGQLVTDPLPPGPGTVTLNDAHFKSANAKTSIHVKEATDGNIAEAIQKLTSQPFSSDQGGSLQTSFTQVYSAAQASFAINASASFMGMGSVSNTFSSASDSHSNHVLVYCRQEYFTLSYMPDATDNAVGDEAFFSSKLKQDEAKPFIGTGNPPLFVQSVTYGSELYLLLDSSYSAQQMEDAFKASASFFVSASVSATAESSAIVNSMTIHTLAIGGRASAQESVSAGVLTGANVQKQLAEYLKKSGDFSSSRGSAQEVGLPISFKLAYLDFTPVAEQATIYGTPHQVSPAALKKATIRFHQNGDGKEQNTQVDITVLDSGGTQAAHWHLGPIWYFPDNSDMPALTAPPISLSVDKPRALKAGLQNGQLTMHITSPSTDVWNFDAHIELEFEDGSKLTGAWLNQSMRSDDPKQNTLTLALNTILH